MTTLATANFNDLAPPAPTGKKPTKWQADPPTSVPRNISSYGDNIGGVDTRLNDFELVGRSSSGKLVTLSNLSPISVVIGAAGLIQATGVSATGAGGTGYAVDDTFSIGGAGTLATGKVTAESGGVVSAVEITATGLNYTVSTGNTTSNIIGTGTGLHIDIFSIITDVNDDLMFMVDNIGGSVATLTPGVGDIDGNPTLAVGPNSGAIFYWDVDLQNWRTMPGIATLPGGSTTQVEYNNAGHFGGITGATSDGTNLFVTTQTSSDNSTKAASTAFVQTIGAALAAMISALAATVAALVTGVSSVFGRAGAVVATSGDYTVAQVTGAASQAGVQNESYTYILDTGAANAYVATLAPAVISYIAGLEVSFKAANANSGASTLNVNGLGTKNIQKWSSGSLVALASGDISVGQIMTVKYDGTQFQVISGGGGGSASPLTTKGDLYTHSTVDTRQPVGPDGTWLVADSTKTTGIDWRLQPFDILFNPNIVLGSGAIYDVAVFLRTVIFPGNFAGAQGHCRLTPATTQTITINKNGSGVGTISVTSLGVFTFTSTSGAAVTYNAGDYMSFTAQAGADTSMVLQIGLTGTR